jgi:multiple sugar transport system permease protein
MLFGGKKITLKRKKELCAYFFIGLPLLYYFLFRILPTLYSFRISLYDWDLLSPNKPFVGLANFHHLFSDKIFRIAMMNTLEYVLVGVPLMIIISLSIAMLLNNIKRGQSLYRLLVFIPYITSSVAIAFVWRWMFMKHGGVINEIVQCFGFEKQLFLESPYQAIYVVISNIVWQSVGFYTIIFVAGLKQIPGMYYEAAEIDGASKFKQFIHITLPLLNKTFVYITVIATIRTLQIFTEIYNITGTSSGGAGGPLHSTTSIVLQLYNMAFTNYKMGLASAATVILFIIILIITVVQMKILNKKDN